MCVLCFCQFPCFKYLPFECCRGAVCTNMSLLILLAPNISFSCVGTDPKQQTLPFQFKQGLLTRPFFSLGGLGLCQKVCICMPNLVMLITHFGQKFKNPPPKCPSRFVWHPYLLVKMTFGCFSGVTVNFLSNCKIFQTQILSIYRAKINS